MKTTADRRLLGVPLGVAAAALPLATLWGYTVDDALIAGRVAAHIAVGLGHRFNGSGPIVDAVTPLGWAWLLAPFARGGPIAALMAAKIIGAVSWLVAAGWLGARIAADAGNARRFLPLAAVALCTPLAAWAASGMETGVVTALSTFALVRSPLAPLAAGLAAAWRPELIPWAGALATGSALAASWGVRASRSVKRIAFAAVLALAPALLVAVVRQLVFGRATPLAFHAKPSDFLHGAVYSMLAFALTGPPWLVVAPVGLRRLDGHERAIVAACGLHFVSMLLAGGDWMVLWRLVVPVLPGFVLVGAALAEHTALWATLARMVVMAGVSIWVFVTTGIPARGVGAHRLELIERAQPVLAGARSVGALDAGLVGAATRATVVEFAGLTDPVIAAFPGGHTSKRLPRGLIESRGVDTLMLLLAPGARIEDPWYESRFARLVEQRVALLVEPDAWRLIATLPLGGTKQSYIVLRKQR